MPCSNLRLAVLQLAVTSGFLVCNWKVTVCSEKRYFMPKNYVFYQKVIYTFFIIKYFKKNLIVIFFEKCNFIR